MPIPVVALDDNRTVLARPRNQPIYDTEGYDNNTAVPLTMTTFANLASFQVSTLSLGPAKVFGRDTNLEGTGGGNIPKGSLFLAYDITAPISYRGVDISGITNVAGFEFAARFRKSLSLTFKFADTPYFSEPFEDIPAGVGIDEVMTTCSNVLVLPIKNGELSRKNRRRMTVANYPVALTQNEQFTIGLQAYSDFQLTTPTNLEVYVSPHLHGLFLRGING